MLGSDELDLDDYDLDDYNQSTNMQKQIDELKWVVKNLSQVMQALRVQLAQLSTAEQHDRRISPQYESASLGAIDSGVNIENVIEILTEFDPIKGHIKLF